MSALEPLPPTSDWLSKLEKTVLVRIEVGQIWREMITGREVAVGWPTGWGTDLESNRPFEFPPLDVMLGDWEFTGRMVEL